MVKPRPSTRGMTNKKGGPRAALMVRWRLMTQSESTKSVRSFCCAGVSR